MQPWARIHAEDGAYWRATADLLDAHLDRWTAALAGRLSRAGAGSGTPPAFRFAPAFRLPLALLGVRLETVRILLDPDELVVRRRCGTPYRTRLSRPLTRTNISGLRVPPGEALATAYRRIRA